MRITSRLRRTAKTLANRTSRALYYWCLSGRIAAQVATGRLIRTGDFLDRVGGAELPDGQKSWYGRHAAKAYRQTHSTEPLQVWAQHRTTGKWIHVFVYGPIDDALYAALRSYKGTRHLLAATFVEAA